MSLPFIDLRRQYSELKLQIDGNIQRVLDHGQYIMGPEVQELEEKLSRYVGTRHCITVGSGTDALLITLMALGVKPGDEIITTPFSFIATAEVIALLGAKPVFVDVCHDTCNINSSLIAAKISGKTRAIIPVSLFGQPADMDEINTVAEANGNIPVIEDAAQSFGSTLNGTKSCNLSSVGCTSFFPSKPLGCYGDGGAIFTSDDELAKTCREIRVHGQSQRYVHTRIGLGGRMDTIQCAVLLAKLEIFDFEVSRRKEVGEFYNQVFDKKGIKRVTQRKGCQSVFAQYTLLVKDRPEIQNKLLKMGIPSAIHYPIPINEQQAYQHLCCPDCTPISSNLSKEVLSIPMGPYLQREDQIKVANELVKLIK